MTDDLDRRQLLQRTAALGLLAAANGCADRTASSAPAPAAPREAHPLAPPAQGDINVAFVISEGAQVIDFAGPWEVFQDARVPGRAAGEHPFAVYTVAESAAPIRASGGLQVVPTYTIETAPEPNVIVIPAQESRSPRLLEWIRTQSKGTDVTMSVCTGAFVLASTGLLAGKRATTYHGAFTQLAMQFPDIAVQRGARFVEDGNLASAGGLSSGIDLALRVVERYFGRDIADNTAYDLEYQGPGWKDPRSQRGVREAARRARPRAVRGVRDGDRSAKAPKTVYAGKTFYFCSPDDQQVFERAPAKFAAATR